MMDAARELVPERLPVGLSGVRAARWLAVCPPAELSFHCRFDGHSRVEVEIRGYASGVVDLDLDYPAAPDADPAPLDATTPAGLSAERLYAERWMFHGPAYQGVRDVGVLGPGGIRGELVSLAARGGLLDNAGQLLGYWVMQQAETDRLAMPVSLSETRFFGPHPAPGEAVTCTVRVRQLSETQVRADVELAVRGKVWASIRGWTDRRFDSDPRVWSVLTFPEQNTIAAPHAEGFVLLRQPWRAAASRDLLSRRYLGAGGRAALKGVLPRDQAPWLMARIAAKDCARHHLWERGAPPIFPIEVEAVDGATAASGRAAAAELRVLVAHHPSGVAVARVLDGGVRHAGAPDTHPVALGIEPLQDGEATATARARVALAVARRALGESAAAGAAEVRETSDERVRVVAGGEALWVETALVDGHMVGWS
ncbi:MAG: polyketide synthase dehydratase domain-containing protein [Polyangiaceae bacterium]